MKNDHGGNELRRLCWWYWQHRLIATKISDEQTSCGWHAVGTVSNDNMVWTSRSLPCRHAVGTVSNDHMIWTSRSLPYRHAVGTVSNDHMLRTSRSLPCLLHLQVLLLHLYVSILLLLKIPGVRKQLLLRMNWFLAKTKIKKVYDLGLGFSPLLDLPLLPLALSLRVFRFWDEELIIATLSLEEEELAEWYKLRGCCKLSSELEMWWQLP